MCKIKDKETYACFLPALFDKDKFMQAYKKNHKNTRSAQDPKNRNEKPLSSKRKKIDTIPNELEQKTPSEHQTRFQTHNNNYH